MRVSIVRSEDLAKDHIAAWQHFQHNTKVLGSPFLTPEFARVASSVRPGVAIAVIEESGGIKGFLPFERHRNVGKPVGDGLSDCQAVIAAPGWDWDARALVSAAGLSVFDFTNLRAGQGPFAPFHRTVVDSPVINLEGGFEAYAAERRANGTNVLTQTMSHARRLERRLGPLRFVLHDPDPRSLHLVIGWKRQQYQATGVSDVLRDPLNVQLLERVHHTQTEDFGGVLSTLWAGDTIIAGHMGMRSPSVLHWWFPAYDAAHAKLAPGRILLLELGRGASAAGIQAIELGEGPEDYKRRFANDAFMVAAGFVGSASLALRLRHTHNAAKAFAGRSLVGSALRWPGKIYRRIDRLRHR